MDIQESIMPSPKIIKTCVTCKATLKGPFCYKCGEKIVKQNDFTVKMLAEQMVDIFTHVDSKLFKSFIALMVRPGLLTVEYIRGIRKPYMKPFQVFLLSNILFFLLLGSTDLFLIPSKWLTDKAFSNTDIPRYANAIAEAQNIPIENLAAIYDIKVVTNSKFFIVLLVPLIALCSYLFGYKQHREYGKHLIYGVHLLAFILLACVFFIQVLAPIFSFGTDILRYISLAAIILYVFLSYRRFVKQALGWQILATLSMMIWLVVLIEIYRNAISLATLWSIQ